MSRVFKVRLQDHTEYEVTATYEVVFDGAYFSYRVDIENVSPSADDKLKEIEYSLGQLILDECESLKNLDEKTEMGC